MCQLWGEFIEIYVKADVEGRFRIKNKVQKKSGSTKKNGQRIILVKALSQ